MLVATDYGGEHSSAEYQTISILLADLQGLVAEWEPKRRNVRTQFTNDGRRLSYKKLGDRQRAKMLLPFLSAANHIPGVIATFLIDRRISSFFCRENTTTDELVVNPNTWKPKTFEKLLRIAHFGSLLIAGMSSERQNVLWLSDQDAIAANFTKHTEATNVIAAVLSGYVLHSLGHIRFGTAQSDDGSLMIEDVLAIPDIAAGAWGEISSNVAGRLGRVAHALNVKATENLLPKAHDVLLWFSDNRHKLKRMAFVIEYVPPNQFKAHMLHSFVEQPTVIT